MRIFGFIVSFFLVFSPLRVQNGMSVTLMHEPFLSADNQPYLETWIWINANTLTYLPKSTHELEARVEISVSVSQKGNIVNYKKFQLSSVLSESIDKSAAYVFDQVRLALPMGGYSMDVYIKDLNDTSARHVHYEDTVFVSFPTDQMSVSPLVFVAEARQADAGNPNSRGGLVLEPFPSVYFSGQENRLRFLTEVYGSKWGVGDSGSVVFLYSVRKIGDELPLPGYARRNKVKAGALNRMLGDLDIRSLPTGHYELCVDILDTAGTYLNRSSKYFYRDASIPLSKMEDLDGVVFRGTFIDSFNGLDTLDEFIRCLNPIMGGNDWTFAANVRKSKDIVLMKKYLYYFWLRRGGEHAASSFRDYMLMINNVNAEFGSPTHRGYETDRGRVYLLYGAPNSVTKRYHEPSAYPYEIWHYHQLRTQANIRFVFYNSSGMDNDFVMIHSDLRGELNNRQWEMFVFNRNNTWNVDQNNVNRHFGNWSRDLYNQPR
jgi:GWxTD domain-containing protein